jgi:F-type H+-transporting ATPase subunit a
MNDLHISISAEPLVKIGPIIITNSLLLSCLVSGFLILIAYWFHQQSKKDQKGGLFYFIVAVYSQLLHFFEKVVGEQAKQFFPLLATLFTFIMLVNWSGLLPGVGSIGIWQSHQSEKLFIPLLRGPTADLNITFALALIAILAIQYFGIHNLGFKQYIKKYLNFSNPINFFVGILEIFSDLSKAISFSFRLFGNIFAGEVLLTVVGAIFPYLAPLPFLGLELFVGFIQALVFTMLSLVFIACASTHH